jgi:hypothetical protein
MATYTLTGDLSGLVGELRAPLDVWAIPYEEMVIEGTTVHLGGSPLTVSLMDGSFSQALPTGYYSVRVRFYDPAAEALALWDSGIFNLNANKNLASVVVVSPPTVGMSQATINTLNGWVNAAATATLEDVVVTDSLVIGGPLDHNGSTVGFYGTTPTTKPTAPTAQTAVAPAGGTGTAAGGWSTAGNRDTAIALINNNRTRIAELETKLRALGLIT